MRRIYLASSWRNPEQPALVGALQYAGFEVYDFKNPRAGGPVRDETPHAGFSWKYCDPEWEYADDQRESFVRMLEHEAARLGFSADFDAMKWANACVLALPCGRSAHLEAGWMAGSGKQLVVYLPENMKRSLEPELMYLIGGAARDVLVLSVDELVDRLRNPPVLPDSIAKIAIDLYMIIDADERRRLRDLNGWLRRMRDAGIDI